MRYGPFLNSGDHGACLYPNTCHAESACLSSPWEMSLNATNLRRASRCKNTSQAVEMSPLTFDVAIRLKRESKEKKNVSAEDLTAAHWKHPTISRSNSSSNQRAHFPFSPLLMCLTWRASPTTAISCQDFIVVGQRKRKGKVPPVFSVEVNRLRAERGRTGNGERASGSQWTVSTWCHVNDCICHSTRLCHSHPCDPSQVHTIEPDFGSGVQYKQLESDAQNPTAFLHHKSI